GAAGRTRQQHESDPTWLGHGQANVVPDDNRIKMIRVSHGWVNSASKAALRIANASGFYGDRLSAPREMLESGPIDVLTGDYLAELTMSLLWRARQKDASAGYAATFLRQMEDVLGRALEK